MEGVDKTTGARTSRSETVGVRLDPKLRYLAELAAREQQRTLSGFIEWAIRKVLQGDVLEEPDYGPDPIPKQPAPLRGEGLWDVDPADRFVLLASARLDLLTIREQRLWKTICQQPLLMDKKGKLNRAKVREFWGDIVTSDVED
jgi:hypothetical protein